MLFQVNESMVVLVLVYERRLRANCDEKQKKNNKSLWLVFSRGEWLFQSFLYICTDHGSSG